MLITLAYSLWVNTGLLKAALFQSKTLHPPPPSAEHTTNSHVAHEAIFLPSKQTDSPRRQPWAGKKISSVSHRGLCNFLALCKISTPRDALCLFLRQKGSGSTAPCCPSPLGSMDNQERNSAHDVHFQFAQLCPPLQKGKQKPTSWKESKQGSPIRSIILLSTPLKL